MDNRRRRSGISELTKHGRKEGKKRERKREEGRKKKRVGRNERNVEVWKGERKGEK